MGVACGRAGRRVVTLLAGGDRPEELNLTEFEAKLDAGEVADAPRSRTATTWSPASSTDGTEYKVTYPADYADELTQQLLDADVDDRGRRSSTSRSGSRCSSACCRSCC